EVDQSDIEEDSNDGHGSDGEGPAENGGQGPANVGLAGEGADEGEPGEDGDDDQGPQGAPPGAGGAGAVQDALVQQDHAQQGVMMDAPGQVAGQGGGPVPPALLVQGPQQGGPQVPGVMQQPAPQPPVDMQALVDNAVAQAIAEAHANRGQGAQPRPQEWNVPRHHEVQGMPAGFALPGQGVRPDLGLNAYDVVRPGPQHYGGRAPIAQPLMPTSRGVELKRLEQMTSEAFVEFWDNLEVFMILNRNVDIGTCGWSLGWQPFLNINGQRVRNFTLPAGWTIEDDALLFNMLRISARICQGSLVEGGNVNPSLGVHALYNLANIFVQYGPGQWIATMQAQRSLRWDPRSGIEGWQEVAARFSTLHSNLRLNTAQDGINLCSLMNLHEIAPMHIPIVSQAVANACNSSDSVDPLGLANAITRSLRQLVNQGVSLTSFSKNGVAKVEQGSRQPRRTAFAANGKAKKVICFRCLSEDGHRVTNCPVSDADVHEDWETNVPEHFKEMIPLWMERRKRKQQPDSESKAFMADTTSGAARDGGIYLDTGAQEALVHSVKMLTGARKLRDDETFRISTANGGVLWPSHVGKLELRVLDCFFKLRTLTVHDAYYVPGLDFTLLGRQALERSGAYVETQAGKGWMLTVPKVRLRVELRDQDGLLRVPAKYFRPDGKHVTALAASGRPVGHDGTDRAPDHEQAGPRDKGQTAEDSDAQREARKGYPGASKAMRPELAHRRLCHVGMSRLQGIEGQVDNFVITKDDEDSDKVNHDCPSCVLAKSKVLDIPRGPHAPRCEGPRQGVAIDASGYKIEGVGGSRYFLVYVDAFTKEVFVDFVGDLQAETLVHSFNKFVGQWARGGKIADHVQVIGDGAFLAEAFVQTIVDRQWSIQACPAREHWGNGLAERAIGVLVPLAQAAMSETRLPLEFWPYAIKFAAHVQRRVPPSAGGKTPYELGTGRRPDLSALRVFGCFALVHQAYHGAGVSKSDFQDRARLAIYLGPSDLHIFGTSDFFMMDTGKLQARRSAHFNEYVFPAPDDDCDTLLDAIVAASRGLSVQHPAIVAGAGNEVADDFANVEDWMIDQPHKERGASEQHDDNMSQAEPNFVEVEYESDDSEPVASDDHEGSKDDWMVHGKQFTYRNGAAPILDDKDPQARRFILTQRTRSGKVAWLAASAAEKERRRILSLTERQMRDKLIEELIAEDPLDIFVEKVHLPEGTDINKAVTPETYKQVLRLPEQERELWVRSMNAEIEGMKRHKTFGESVPEREAKRKGAILPSTWAFKIKASGRIKSRLCMRGDLEKNHRPGEFSSPTASMREVMTTIVFGLSQPDWTMIVVDSKQAFLHPGLDRDVFLRPPDEVRRALKVPPGHVVRLNKSVYGLASASLEWYLHIRKLLEDFGFKALNSAPCIFVAEGIVCACYVDDMVTLGDETRVKSLLLHLQRSNVGITVDEREGRLLGMAWKFDNKARTVELSMAEYETALLSRFDLEDVGTARSPSTPHVQLPFLQKEDSQPRYREMVGCLNYLANVRPELRNAVRMLSRHSNHNDERHMAEMQRCFGYLKKTLGQGITLRGVSKGDLQLKCYVDASWGDCNATRSSTSGWAIFFGDSMVTCKSKSQPAIAENSMEAEIYAFSEASKIVVKMRTLVQEMGAKLSTPTPIFGDNQSALETFRNVQYASRAKHLDIRELRLRELLEKGEIDLFFVRSEYQVADVLTKAVGVNIVARLGSVLRLGLRGEHADFLDECPPEPWPQKGVSENRSVTK
ncbi:Transposon, partial [Hondaea fermentalgiana]